MSQSIDFASMGITPPQLEIREESHCVKISLLVTSLVLFSCLGIFGGIATFASSNALPLFMMHAVGTIGYGGCMAVFTVSTFLAVCSAVGIVLLCKSNTIPLDDTLQPNLERPLELPRKPLTWTINDLKALSFDTRTSCAKGFYTAQDGKQIPLRTGRESHEKSSIYLTKNSVEALETAPLPSKFATKITVVEKDTLEAAEEAIQEGGDVAIVNFAGPETPGGGFVDEGLGSQEEDICYRSDLGGLFAFEFRRLMYPPEDEKDSIFSLSQDAPPSFFPLYGHLIYTPKVTVFRKSRPQHYDLLDVPFKIGVLSSAPLRHCQLVPSAENGITYADVNDKHKMMEIIKNQLYTAYSAGHDTLILGAFGCGAFRNPPEVVAKLYNEVIDKYFKGVFKKIIFAILEDPFPGSHNPNGNIKPFRTYFQDSAL